MAKDNNRRDFLKTIAFGSVAASGLLLNNWTETKAANLNKPTTQPCSSGMVNYFDKGKPLTISMWDFSWLLAHHKGGPYENLAKRVEEAAERGYNIEAMALR